MVNFFRLAFFFLSVARFRCIFHLLNASTPENIESCAYTFVNSEAGNTLFLYSGETFTETCCPVMAMKQAHNGIWKYSLEDEVERSWIPVFETSNFNLVLDMFDPWNLTLYQQPGSRTDHLLLSMESGKSLVVFGGIALGRDGLTNFVNDVWRWDLGINRWEYLSGDPGDQMSNNDVENGVLAARIRSTHFKLDETSFVIHGGMQRPKFMFTSYSIYPNEMWKFDVTTSKFELIEYEVDDYSPRASADASGWIVHSPTTTFYQFGGIYQPTTDSMTVYNSLHSFKWSSRKWELLYGEKFIAENTLAFQVGINIDHENNLPGSVSLASSFLVSSNKYLAFYGGLGCNFNTQSSAKLANLWFWDIGASQWILIKGGVFTSVSKTDDDPGSLVGAQALQIQDDFVVFLGGEDANSDMNGGYYWQTSCFGVSMLENEACGENGECVNYNVCECHDSHFGQFCCETVDLATYYEKTNHLYINYNFQTEECEESILKNSGFECSDIIVDIHALGRHPICVFENGTLSIKLGDRAYVSSKKKLRVKILTTGEIIIIRLRIVEYFARENVVIIVSVSVGTLICLVLCVSCLTLWIVLRRLSKQKIHLSRFQSLKHFDILLEEQRLEEGDLARLKFNKDAYKIDYSSLKFVTLLGGGAQASVFLVIWSEIQCAFKVYNTLNLLKSQDEVKAFERELEIAVSCNFPFILQTYGVALRQPRVGILSKYCAHGDMKEYICGVNVRRGGISSSSSSEGSIQLRMKVRWLIELASALSYLHTNQIIHRDVKMENTLIDEHLSVQLCDFGISRNNNSDASRNGGGEMTFRVGSEYYMSPEMYLGNKKYTEKTDSYSFAILMVFVPNFPADVFHFMLQYILLSEKFLPYSYSDGETDFMDGGLSLSLSITSVASKAALQNLRPDISVLEEEMNIPADLISIVVSCWKREKDERLSCSVIVEKLKDFQASFFLEEEESDEYDVEIKRLEGLVNENLKRIGELKKLKQMKKNESSSSQRKAIIM